MIDMMPTAEDLARDLTADLRLCSEATEGPWTVMQDHEDPDNWTVMTSAPGWCGFHDLGIMLPRDAQFIATSRTGWPATIRRALTAETEVSRLQGIVTSLAERCASQSEASGQKGRTHEG